MPYNASAASRKVAVQSIAVSLEVAPSPPWTAGQSITLTATVTKDGAPYSGATVCFRWFTGTTPYTIGYEQTDAYGVATREWTIPWRVDTTTVPCRDGTVYAFEVDSGTYAYVNGKVAYSTSITIAAPNSVMPNQPFTISGVLEYESAMGVWSPLAGKTVSLYYDTTKIGDVTTAADGSYAKTDVKIPTAGTYTLKAKYAGEAAQIKLEIPEAIKPMIAPLAALLLGGAAIALTVRR